MQCLFCHALAYVITATIKLSREEKRRGGGGGRNFLPQLRDLVTNNCFFKARFLIAHAQLAKGRLC